MRTLALRLLGAAAAAAAFLAAPGPGRTSAAVQAPSPVQPPVFTSAVEVVRLDVIVLGRDGKPVSGLTREDFVVEEGGQRQTIESFEPVVVAARPVPAMAAPPRLSAARVRAPGEGRSFYVFFDDAHVTATPSEYVRVALRRFIRGELREGDWVTLAAPQQGLWWTARNAWEYRQLESVVGRLKGQYVRDPGAKFGMSGLSDFQAMCIVEGLPSEMCGVSAARPAVAVGGGGGGGGGSGGSGGSGGAGGGGAGGGAGAGGGGGASGGGSGSSSAGGGTGGGSSRGGGGVMGVGQSNVSFLAEEVYARARRRIDLTLGGLRQALDSLVPLRGHKSLLLISEGFILIPDMPGYAELLDAARRANVAVHFYDPRGLESGWGEDEAPGLGWATKRNLEMAGAGDIAVATGGRSLLTNDPAVGLRQVASESEAYYLLGYSPTAQKPGERKVKVRVTREGLSVRARSRYYVENPVQAAASRAQAEKKDAAGGHTPEERAAMRALTDTTDLPLRVSTLHFEPTAGGEVTTLCAAEIRLPADVSGTRRIAAITEARPRDGGPAVRDTFEQEVRVTPGAPAIVSRQWRMPPGVWQLRLLLRDTTSGRIGTAIHTFEVPQAKGLRLSTPILTPELEKVDGRDRPRIVLGRTFHPGQILYCQYQVHGAAADAAERLPRVSGRWELRQGDAVVRASAPTRIRAEADGRVARLVGVSLADLEAGDYSLVLAVRDEVAGADTTVEEAFSVVP